MKPSIGRIVHYRSRTGKYDVPAMITATHGQLALEGVIAGAVPPLSSETRVHLQVFSPGTPGKRYGAQDFLAESEQPVQENVNGVYQEWDIPFFDGEVSADIGVSGSVPMRNPDGSAGERRTVRWDDVPPGSWRWPSRS